MTGPNIQILSFWKTKLVHLEGLVQQNKQKETDYGQKPPRDHLVMLYSDMKEELEFLA
jgi:hypothetical protein